jgi:hypothetical protein
MKLLSGISLLALVIATPAHAVTYSPYSGLIQTGGATFSVSGADKPHAIKAGPKHPNAGNRPCGVLICRNASDRTY